MPQLWKTSEYFNGLSVNLLDLICTVEVEGGLESLNFVYMSGTRTSSAIALLMTRARAGAAARTVPTSCWPPTTRTTRPSRNLAPTMPTASKVGLMLCYVMSKYNYYLSGLLRSMMQGPSVEEKKIASMLISTTMICFS